MIVAVLKFDCLGTGHSLFTEAIDLSLLGALEMVRASIIEFDHPSQKWEVRNLAGNLLFRHPSRHACLDWEQHHFNRKP